MKFRFISKILEAVGRRVLEDYVVINKNQEGVVKEGSFMPYNFNIYKVVDKTKNLILQKGKYKILFRDQSQIGPEEPIGMFVVDNSEDSYDKFWGDTRIVDQYLDDSRLKFYEDVFSTCREYFQNKVIDVGCGSGDFLKIINEHDAKCDIYGIDFSLSSVQRCQEKIPNGKFTVGDIYRIEYDDSTFNVVIAMEVLEHLEKPDEAFKEIRRICKRDGKIIITIPNGDYDDYIGHLNFWNESDFRNFLGDVNLLEFHYLQDKRSMLFIIQN